MLQETAYSTLSDQGSLREQAYANSHDSRCYFQGEIIKGI